MNKRQIGTLYEEKAARCLQAAGYEILERNYRCRAGEIDLIAKDLDFFVFVEVKYRENASMGTPLEAVGKTKQQKIRHSAAWYLAEKGLSFETRCRFDVVGICKEDIQVVQDAF